MSNLTRGTVRDSLSVALTVGAYGTAFGAAGVAGGFSVLQTCLFSLLTFSGASQFAAVGVVASGGAAASAIATAALLGTRNALYGIQMAPLLRGEGSRRLVAAQITIDESTGVALSQAPRGDPRDARGILADRHRRLPLLEPLHPARGTRSEGARQSRVLRTRRRRAGGLPRAHLAPTADELPANGRGRVDGLRATGHAVVPGRGCRSSPRRSSRSSWVGALDEHRRRCGS